MMDKTYQPAAIEKKWYQRWEESGYFQPQAGAHSYCIMLPPPNVTGTLHMGHAFQDTLMDLLIRYNRMKGAQTLWQGGTDHAGIATQMVVERQLQTQGITKHGLGREAFLEKVWEWKEQSGNTISSQMRRLGASIDWSRERFTMDPGLSEAVKEVFVRLFDEGLIYRGKRLVNWDPKLHTAVSDLEVVSEEEDGFMWHIRYPIADSTETVTVATTRPETLLGDAAVAVHPNDERYQHLIGKMVQLPLCQRLIPIIADDFVDPAFGSGCVKITPAHDFNDHEVGKRHGLAMLNIFTEDAVLNTNAPLAYQGLPRFVAREKIINDLEKAHLLEKVEPHKLKIPRCDRTGEIVEPYLTNQWFVSTKSLAAPAIEAVKSQKIQFVPENWTKTYFEWMNNIQDWCISRQLWWGHRIPAWYDNHGNVYVARSTEEVRQKYNLGPDVELKQDNDVLDTWFSSALWPFSTLGWPQNEEELKQYYPTSVLVTGFDIIFFWVARMIMMGLKFTGEVPFKTVYVHGLIQDADGQKMSKSKGNIIDPLDLIDGISLENLLAKRTTGLMQPQMAAKIEKSTRKHFPDGIPSYGTDALRFTFCALASNTRFIRFDLARIEGYGHFCNKLWNAARYLLMKAEGQALPAKMDFAQLSLCEKWIWSAWQTTKRQVEDYYAQYRFDLAAQALYDFTWNQYCDWYLEISKPQLTQEADPTLVAQTRFTLVAVFEELLRVLHPMIPFITDEIWQMIKPCFVPEYFEKQTDSIMIQRYPEVQMDLIDEQAVSTMEWIQSFIVSIRTIRSEMNVNPGKAFKVLCKTNNDAIRKEIEKNRGTLQTLAKIESLSWLAAEEMPPVSATTLVKEVEIFIPLAGIINKEQEIKRLQKEIDKLNKEIEGCQTKLNNPGYVNKAPAEVVAKEQQRVEVAQSSKQKLKDNLEKMQAL
jgi:valyl-tRNA synthetase